MLLRLIGRLISDIGRTSTVQLVVEECTLNSAEAAEPPASGLCFSLQLSCFTTVRFESMAP